MALGSDFFGALDKYLKNSTKLDMVEGVVQAITGATALVRISGSDRAQEAWYSKGANLMPGDRCVLVRTNRNSRWIVMGGFGTSLTGHNDQTPPSTGGIDIPGSGQVLTSNVTSGPLGYYTANVNQTTWTSLGSFSAASPGGILLVGAGVVTHDDANIGGNSPGIRILVGSAGSARMGTVIQHAFGYAPLTLIYPFLVGEGTYTVTLQGNTNITGTAVSTVFDVVMFWAATL